MHSDLKLGFALVAASALIEPAVLEALRRLQRLNSSLSRRLPSACCLLQPASGARRGCRHHLGGPVPSPHHDGGRCRCSCLRHRSRQSFEQLRRVCPRHVRCRRRRLGGRFAGNLRSGGEGRHAIQGHINRSTGHGLHDAAGLRKRRQLDVRFAHACFGCQLGPGPWQAQQSFTNCCREYLWVPISPATASRGHCLCRSSAAMPLGRLTRS